MTARFELTRTDLDERYELGRLLGRGGGGRVLEARQRSTGQAVAVKLLEFDAEASEQVQNRRRARFRREMEICARLRHPDVVHLLDYGEHDGGLYSVFELVSGETLAQWLDRDGALPLARAHILGTQMLEVLAHAHNHGVIHRDIKPSNLMVQGAGERIRIKVLDFGVSALSTTLSAATFTRLTHSNEMVGTPAYAAPEQLRGDAPTAATDLYAWGLVMLECITGVSVMSGASLGEVFQNQLSPNPVPIPARLREHPLGTVLRWALEKDPRRRASSAPELLARLEVIDAAALGQLCDPQGFFVDRTAPAPSPDHGAHTATSTILALRVEGERRHVIALCCRIGIRCVGDPVEATLLDAYRSDLIELAHATVDEFGGVHVGGFGDCVLYYFGVPRARDSDARRAGCAALELSARIRSRSAVLERQSQIRVCLKAGLNVGLLNVGVPGTSRSFGHDSVASLASTLALHDRTPDEASIMASDAFRQVNARYAEYHDGPSVELPWSSTLVTVHRLTSESLEDVLDRDVGPMVGRARELEHLLEAFHADEGGCRAVLIIAEAGMGKSRLVHELRRRVGEAGHGALTLHALPEMERVALGPLRELLTRELALALQPTCADLVAALSPFAVDLAIATPLLCGWMSAPLEPPYTPLPYSPQKQRAMLGALLVDLVCALLEPRNGYLEVEDLHWADPSTLAWLGTWLGSAKAGALTLMTARPEFEPRWEAIELSKLELGALDPSDVASLIAGLPAGEGIGATLVEQIVSRADGVPLFVEELTRVLAEQLRAAQTGAPPPQLPSTLRGLLLSRLDALGPAKETAQYAAAIGREFDRELLLASVSSRDEATLLADLGQLLSTGLVVERRQLGRVSHLFRHALLRDAAYESMTPTGLSAVHDAIADAMLEQFPERVAIRPDLAALHLERGGRDFEAQGYWLAAGRSSLKASAHEESAAQLQHGLEVLARCGEGPSIDNAELDLLNGLGASLIAKFGYGHPDVGATFERADKLLSRGAATAEREFMTQWGLFAFEMIRPAGERALEIAEQMLAGAQAAEDPALTIAANAAGCRAHMVLARHDEAIACWKQSQRSFDREQHGGLFTRFGEPPHVVASTFAACSLILCGRVEEAFARVDEALTLARDLGFPSAIASTLGQSAWVRTICGTGEPSPNPWLQRAREDAGEAMAIAGKYGFPLWAGYAHLMDGLARISLGDVDAVEGVQQGSDMWMMAGAGLGRTWQLAYIGEGRRQQGRLDDAATAVKIGLEHAQTKHEHFFVAELHRLDARIKLCNESDRDEVGAERSLGLAIGRARAQGAHLLELRAALDLHTLLSERGQPAQAKAALDSAAQWWREHSLGVELDCVRRALS